jgi:hypothetical protein
MARNRRSILLCLAAAIAAFAFTAGGASAATRTALPSSVTFETPAGPITCNVPTAPSWADVVVSTSLTTLTAEVISAGSLRCDTTSFGEIELAGAGFPWHLTVNTKHRQVRLRGTKKVVIELTVLSLGAKCVYEAGKLTGSLSTETPPVLSVSAPRVKLNTKRSFSLCPTGGSFSGSFPLG